MGVDEFTMGVVLEALEDTFARPKHPRAVPLTLKVVREKSRTLSAGLNREARAVQTP